MLQEGRAGLGTFPCKLTDEAGDGFIYLVNMTSQRVDDRFEWLEVTEVFTTVPAWQIEGAMRIVPVVFRVRRAASRVSVPDGAV